MVLDGMGGDRQLGAATTVAVRNRSSYVTLMNGPVADMNCTMSAFKSE